MDIPDDKEGEFNRVYDTEHVPNILKVQGVHGCTRYKLESTDGENMARYVALYEIDSPELPTSEAWLNESEKGDWPGKIRPHTFNRSRSVFRKLG
jgi:hypothetical protein